MLSTCNQTKQLITPCLRHPRATRLGPDITSLLALNNFGLLFFGLWSLRGDGLYFIPVAPRHLLYIHLWRVDFPAPKVSNINPLNCQISANESHCWMRGRFWSGLYIYVICKAWKDNLIQKLAARLAWVLKVGWGVHNWINQVLKIGCSQTWPEAHWSFERRDVLRSVSVCLNWVGTKLTVFQGLYAIGSGIYNMHLRWDSESENLENFWLLESCRPDQGPGYTFFERIAVLRRSESKNPCLHHYILKLANKEKVGFCDLGRSCCWWSAKSISSTDFRYYIYRNAVFVHFPVPWVFGAQGIPARLAGSCPALVLCRQPSGAPKSFRSPRTDRRFQPYKECQKKKKYGIREWSLHRGLLVPEKDVFQYEWFTDGKQLRFCCDLQYKVLG